MKKTLATLIAVALVGAAFVAPADAKKKKKKKKPPPPPVCETFVPGEAGAEAELFTLTDEHTEEAPLEVMVSLELSTADVTQVTDESTAFFNIQVDSKLPEAGVYALFGFPQRRDYDLNMLHTDGSYAARSRAWNTVIEVNDNGTISATGHGGESTASSEKLLGIKTADCAGWTIRADNWLGEGGEMPIQLWLGEVATDPQAPGEETP